MIAAFAGRRSADALAAEALAGARRHRRAGAPMSSPRLLDLHRISLTYVTNKKGGDQIIETLSPQVERDQRADGIARPARS